MRTPEQGLPEMGGPCSRLRVRNGRVAERWVAERWVAEDWVARHITHGSGCDAPPWMC